jgi:hypothetical protein
VNAFPLPAFSSKIHLDGKPQPSRGDLLLASRRSQLPAKRPPPDAQRKTTITSSTEASYP